MALNIQVRFYRVRAVSQLSAATSFRYRRTVFRKAFWKSCEGRQPRTQYFKANGTESSALPLSASIIASIVALALLIARWWRVGLVLLGLVSVAVWIAATPVFANWLNWRLQSEIPHIKIEDLPQSDVVILLSGVGADFYNPTNRIVYASRIYHAGKAPMIIISGGTQPGQQGAVPDAKVIADRLVRFGVPRFALILEADSRSTRENAVNTAAICNAYGWRDGLLVTTATHMPRALAAFQRVGLHMVPASTGVQAPPRPEESRLDLRIDAWAFLQTTGSVREIIAFLIYRCLGWA